MQYPVCTNFKGEISPLECLRPIKSDKIIVDTRGDKWQQVTIIGYKRIADNYFWPEDPTKSNNPLGILPLTIQEIEKQRLNYRKSSEKFKI